MSDGIENIGGAIEAVPGSSGDGVDSSGKLDALKKIMPIEKAPERAGESGGASGGATAKDPVKKIETVDKVTADLKKMEDSAEQAAEESRRLIQEIRKDLTRLFPSIPFWSVFKGRIGNIIGKGQIELSEFSEKLKRAREEFQREDCPA